MPSGARDLSSTTGSTAWRSFADLGRCASKINKANDSLTSSRTFQDQVQRASILATHRAGPLLRPDLAQRAAARCAAKSP
eukprot:g20321.t1